MEKKYYKLLSWIDMIVGGILLILSVAIYLFFIISPSSFEPITQSVYDYFVYLFLVLLLILSGILLFKKKEKYKKHEKKLKILSILDIVMGFVLIIGVAYNSIYPPTITYSQFMIAGIFDIIYPLLLFISGFILEELS